MRIEEIKAQNEKIKEIIKEYDLKNKSRENNYKWQRQYIFKYLRDLGYTFASIGAMFDKHHATIIHGCNKAEELIETNDVEFSVATHQLALSIEDADLRPVWRVDKKLGDTIKNPYTEMVNKIMNLRDMQDVESLKAFVSENIR